MAQNRLFLPQSTLDSWLSENKVTMEGDRISILDDGGSFRVTSAVHFIKEVTGNKDTMGLINKVKDLDQVKALGGEYCNNSVVFAEHAYDVIEGFLGEPIESTTQTQRKRTPSGNDIDLLARFFLNPR